MSFRLSDPIFRTGKASALRTREISSFTDPLLSAACDIRVLSGATVFRRRGVWLGLGWLTAASDSEGFQDENLADAAPQGPVYRLTV
jgi:hypothetical protein